MFEWQSDEREFEIDLTGAGCDVDLNLGDNVFAIGDFYVESEVKEIKMDTSSTVDAELNKCVEAEMYDGDYKVTPKTQEQILETKDKLMADDVTVRKIPFYETTNNTGGTTVYIASEV